MIESYTNIKVVINESVKISELPMHFMINLTNSKTVRHVTALKHIIMHLHLSTVSEGIHMNDATHAHMSHSDRWEHHLTIFLQRNANKPYPIQ